MRSGRSGTPATPWRRSTPACPARPARPCWPRCGPSRVVASDGEQHVLAGGLPTEEGDALVVATSGSSGQPKGVVLTHDALLASARATSDRLGIDPARHSWLACLPLAHVGGLSVVTRALLDRERPSPCCPGSMPKPSRSSGVPGPSTHVSLVAAALRRLDPSVFTGILLGGSRPPGDLPPNVVTTYGMTETGSGVVYDGVPLDDVEVAIAHFDDGRRGRGRRARSSSAPPCSCAATAMGRPGVCWGPTARRPGSPPVTPGIPHRGRHPRRGRPHRRNDHHRG